MEFLSCRICKRAVTSKKVNLGPKGFKKIISVSNIRGDGLFTDNDDASAVIMHLKCRAVYINDKCVAAAVKNNRPPLSAVYIPSNPSISVATKPFDFQKKCYFCAEDASEDFIKKEQKKPPAKRISVSRVFKTETKETVIKFSYILDDPWRKEVRERIQQVDLVTLCARYHRPCYSKFTMPVSGRKRGRPECPEILDQMEHLYQLIESTFNDRHFCIKDVKDSLPEMELPSGKTIKRKLKDRYGNKLAVLDSEGRPTIFCFVNTLVNILQENDVRNRSQIQQTNQNESRNEEVEAPSFDEG